MKRRNVALLIAGAMILAGLLFIMRQSNAAKNVAMAHYLDVRRENGSADMCEEGDYVIDVKYGVSRTSVEILIDRKKHPFVAGGGGRYVIDNGTDEIVEYLLYK